MSAPVKEKMGVDKAPHTEEDVILTLLTFPYFSSNAEYFRQFLSLWWFSELAPSGAPIHV